MEKKEEIQAKLHEALYGYGTVDKFNIAGQYLECQVCQDSLKIFNARTGYAAGFTTHLEAKHVSLFINSSFVN